MMKGLHLLPVVVTLAGHLVALGLAQDICPPPDVLAPCSCSDRGTKIISCVMIPDPNFNMKGVLDRASEYISDDVVFDTLYIYNNSITEIADGAVEHLKFQTVTILFNRNLEYISPRAFGATRNITGVLDLSQNKLKNESPRGRDVFDLVNSFEKLSRVDISKNDLTSIPANALNNHPHLESISFSRNRISHIGSSAFAGAVNLKRLHLDNNLLPSEGLPEDAFEGLSASQLVSLEWNAGIWFLEQKSYQILLDRAAAVYVGGEICFLDWCYQARVFVCDKRADWLCEKEETYRSKLGNRFACILSFGDVWDYCAKKKGIIME